MAIEGVIKKWGNSMGVLIPKEVVKREKLRINEKIFFNIVKKADLTNIFRSLERKMSGQEFKDMVRKGWK